MEKDVPFKTSIDVARIRKSCRIVEKSFHFLSGFMRPGISTCEISHKVEEFICSQAALPVLKGYRGFPHAVCTSVNNVAAHGIPGDYRLEQGDIVTTDLTVALEGWHGDAAWTFVVGEPSADALRLLRAAWQATAAGIAAARAGETLGDVGHAISQAAGRLGCAVIQDYVGHGIGEQMHEEPRIPNFGIKGQGMRIVPGMVFTIEPIVTLGKQEVKILEDGWTVITADGSLSAQFEHTIAIFRDRIEVLSFAEAELAHHLDQPPFF